MIPPKDSAISAASGTFGATEIGKWLPLLVGSEVFRLTSLNFFDVRNKLTAVTTGSLQAKQLEAAYNAINRLGALNASSKGSEGEYSIRENREGLLEYAMAVIYGKDYRPRFIFQSAAVRNRAVF